MAAQESEIRYLTPPSVDTKRKKYCRFKKSGIKYTVSISEDESTASEGVRKYF